MTSQTPIIRKKICVLGAFAVGKTSLVRRFLDDGFSEKYLSAIGVKIEKKGVDTSRGRVEFMIWDIHGADHFTRIQPVCLRGSAGCFLVADATDG